MQARRFAQEYVVNFNAIRAYIRAFRAKDENGEERIYAAFRKAASKRQHGLSGIPENTYAIGTWRGGVSCPSICVSDS